MGPQFRYGTLEAWLASGGLAASPSVRQWGLARACPAYSPAQLPQGRLRRRERVGCICIFRSFQALASLTA